MNPGLHRSGRVLFLTFATTLSLHFCGCAGARVDIAAAECHYPVSMSPLVRDRSGVLFDGRSLKKTGQFVATHTSVGLFYGLFTPRSVYDISHEIDRQVELHGGEAIVNLTVDVRGSCSVLNSFPLLNVLPFWPGCVPITISGDIVRRQ